MVKKIYIWVVLLFFAIIASGCASNIGTVKAITAPTDETVIKKQSNLALEIKTIGDLVITSSDLERISKLILIQIKSEYPRRFKTINSISNELSTLRATVIIRRYDPGNAFARAMLIGLGQIHIDADVTLVDIETNKDVASYDVTKTFAMGGIWGATTDIKDVEEGFAKAVAASIMGITEPTNPSPVGVAHGPGHGQ
ncbi:MAG: hypothetical protein HQK55_11470 [Deltaproteobacteria bacterium]|nr:hypothetical protein [Deltaproteobacteria bacterium]